MSETILIFTNSNIFENFEVKTVNGKESQPSVHHWDYRHHNWHHCQYKHFRCTENEEILNEKIHFSCIIPQYTLTRFKERNIKQSKIVKLKVSPFTGTNSRLFKIRSSLQVAANFI